MHCFTCVLDVSSRLDVFSHFHLRFGYQHVGIQSGSENCLQTAAGRFAAVCKLFFTPKDRQQSIMPIIPLAFWPLVLIIIHNIYHLEAGFRAYKIYPDQ